MTELKTLKDMKVKEGEIFEFKDGTCFILTSREADLINYFLNEIEKAEAVKWVKYMENYYKSNLGEQMIFIKEFFNLTEEDLKETEQ